MISSSDSMGGVVSIIIDILFVFGPVVGYVPQYKSIIKRRSSEGFSTLVSFILLVANILRCFFWLGKRFELVLLYQSIVMICAQLVMLELCVRLRPPELASHHRTSSVMGLDLAGGRFWNWPDFASYLYFLGLVVVGVSVPSFFLMQYAWFVDALGFLSLTIESTLGLPQLYKNYRTGSTAGLSWELILSWFLGDSFKTVYFIADKGTPVQFVFCGVVQLLVDILITLQILTSKQQGI